ncbi:hypothetical protein BDR06DRAFT_1010039 [Suillus hirtellus]|nr:hypothetical protein BDR06DRAFT_1010039 [Suillus hirtellus]
MLANISKGTILYFTPVLMLTALLLSLFLYLAPTVMLHSQVALLTATPSSALMQPGSTKAVDGPSIFLGPLGSCSRPNNEAGLTCWFSENFWKYNILAPVLDSDRLEATVARYDAQSPQYFTWVEWDLGQCALALLKHYKDPESEVLSRTFYAVSAKLKYTQFASILQQALGKPVSFVSSQTTGMQEMDDMYAFQSEFGLYPDTAIPDPRLINLGVKFNTMEGFVQEIKGRYA